MTGCANRYRQGLIVLIAMVLILVAILYGPNVWLRWHYQRINSLHESRLVQEAQGLLDSIQQSTSAPLHFVYQDLMVEAGHQRETERQYRYWMEKDPASAALQALYSRILLDPKQKTTWLDKAVATDPKNETVLFVQTEKNLNTGKTASAETFLSEIKTDSWLKSFLDAQIAIRLDQLERAQKSLEIALNDESSPLSVAIGYAHFLTHWTDLNQTPRPNPFAKWSRASQENPIAFAYYCWLAQKPVDKTAETFSEETYYHPEALAILCRPFLQSHALWKEKTPVEKKIPTQIDPLQLDTVRKFIQQAARLDAYNPEVLIAQGMLALVKDDVSEKDLQKAQTFFTTGLEGTPSFSSPSFHARMGDDLTSLGQYDIAARHYLKAWRDLPEHGAFLKNLAASHMEKKEHNQALKILEKAKSFIPRDAAVHYKMSEIYLEQEELDLARRAFGEIIMIDEQDKYARDMISEIWMKNGNPARAIQVYDALLLRDPENGHCYAQIARVLLRSGGIGKAEAYIRRKRAEHPQARDMDEMIRALNEIELAKTK